MCYVCSKMSDYGPAEKVKADEIAAVFRDEIRADVEELKAKGIHPTLVAFLGTGDVAAKKYSEWTAKACEADGIKFEVREARSVSSLSSTPRLAAVLARCCARPSTHHARSAVHLTPRRPRAQVDKMDLEEALAGANQDTSVHGILIYYPCFGAAPSFYGGSMDDYLRDSVPIEKDVEGLCHTYRHHLYHNIRYVDTQVLCAQREGGSEGKRQERGESGKERQCVAQKCPPPHPPLILSLSHQLAHAHSCRRKSTRAV